jgi:hypothetical protein
LNRPGRFHYHFIIGNPDPDEVREYMMDKLNSQYHDTIDKIVSFSQCVETTYDVLRALVFELNQGYSLSESLLDLNIGKEGNPKFNIRIEWMDGIVNETIDYVNFWRDDTTLTYFNFNENLEYRLTYRPSDIITDYTTGIIHLPVAAVSIRVNKSDFSTTAEYEAFKARKIKSITLTRDMTTLTNKYVV